MKTSWDNNKLEWMFTLWLAIQGDWKWWAVQSASSRDWILANPWPLPSWHGYALKIPFFLAKLRQISIFVRSSCIFSVLMILFASFCCITLNSCSWNLHPSVGFVGSLKLQCEVAWTAPHQSSNQVLFVEVFLSHRDTPSYHTLSSISRWDFPWFSRSQKALQLLE